MPGIADQAVALLADAAAATTPDSSTAAGTSDDAQQLLLDLTAWPTRLVTALSQILQHMNLLPDAVWAKAAVLGSPASLADVLAAPHSQQLQERLVQELGDLEELWTKQQQLSILWKLPLPAMQLLLSSNDLKVACEDTVLLTANTYMQQQEPPEQQSAAMQALAELIRCPHLSHF